MGWGKGVKVGDICDTNNNKKHLKYLKINTINKNIRVEGIYTAVLTFEESGLMANRIF